MSRGTDYLSGLAILKLDRSSVALALCLVAFHIASNKACDVSCSVSIMAIHWVLLPFVLDGNCDHVNCVLLSYVFWPIYLDDGLPWTDRCLCLGVSGDVFLIAAFCCVVVKLDHALTTLPMIEHFHELLCLEVL